ncbi:MAG TPA: hypothetical protein VGN69_07995 [Solirubrobacteraceae bacterium]|jgi:outer membrane murein-binding lipoprotein Lpp|nr:hypothetical protein [Solirubrobacteraceae bacterium]
MARRAIHRRTHALITLLASAALMSGVLGGATAQASPFSSTFADYKAHAKVDPCAHSQQELSRARSQVPPDIQQYAPDFPAALDAALAARARGACSGAAASSGAAAAPGAPGGATSGSGPGGGVGPGAGSGSGGAGTPGPPATGSAPPADRSILAALTAPVVAGGAAPVPLLIILILAGVLGLGALGWWLARWRGWEPRWLPDLRHTVAESGYRAAGTWSEFTDWVRLGH